MIPGRVSRHRLSIGSGLPGARSSSALCLGCNEASGSSDRGGNGARGARRERRADHLPRRRRGERRGRRGRRRLPLFDVSYRDPADGAYKTYCLPDRDGKTLSPSRCRATGIPAKEYVAQSDVITFACTNSPLAKCVRWGYKPWKTVNGVSLRDHHLACVRMIRADYCGDGRPHTRDGTLIDVYDRLGIQKRVEQPDMVFEAAWGPGGATYVARPRIGRRHREDRRRSAPRR